MPTSVRLDPETEHLLARLARTRGRSKSEIIREALRRLADDATAEQAEDSTYMQVADLIGIVDSPELVPARDHRKALRESLERKHRRR